MTLPLSRLISFSLVVSAPALAQSYSTQISALQPLAVRATSATIVQTEVEPAGSLPATGVVFVGNYFGSIVSTSRLDWTSDADDTRAEVTLRSQLLALSGPTATAAASAGPNELLVEFQPTDAPSAVLEISSSWTSSVGSAAGTGAINQPLVRVDLQNDGSFDFLAPSGSLTVPLPAGQLYQVRVVMESSLPPPAQPGLSLAQAVSTLSLAVRPRNNILVSQTVSPCQDEAPLLTLSEAFISQGLVIDSAAVTPLAVLAIGFSPLVVTLPVQSSLLPCILLPQPEVVLPILQQQPQSLLIPLPPVFRPATFYVQAVALSDQGDLLGVSPGYTVLAQ